MRCILHTQSKLKKTNILRHVKKISHEPRTAQYSLWTGLIRKTFPSLCLVSLEDDPGFAGLGISSVASSDILLFRRISIYGYANMRDKMIDMSC